MGADERRAGLADGYRRGITNGASAAMGCEAVGRGKVGAMLERGKADEPGVGLQAQVIRLSSSMNGWSGSTPRFE